MDKIDREIAERQAQKAILSALNEVFDRLSWGYRLQSTFKGAYWPNDDCSIVLSITLHGPSGGYVKLESLGGEDADNHLFDESTDVWIKASCKARIWHELSEGYSGTFEGETLDEIEEALPEHVEEAVCEIEEVVEKIEGNIRAVRSSVDEMGSG